MSAHRGRRSAIVVGASIAGLSAAMALARANWSVLVLERAPTARTGMGLAIDLDLLSAVTGLDTSRVPVIEAGYNFTGWGLLHDALRSHALTHSSVQIRYGVTVSEVQINDRGGDALAKTTKGNLRADLIVGADGYRSIVRHAVAPGRPNASFSGFVLWRGITEESAKAGGFGASLGLDIEESADGVLATFVIPGADGAIRRGQRRGVFTWFDASRNRELEAAGRITGDSVRGTWHGREVPTRTVAELVGRAGQWRSSWEHSIAQTLHDRRFIGTPVAEYLPTDLVRGPVALIGDAAHAVSPVTGAGFHNALLDVQALVHALSDVPNQEVSTALNNYNRNRLPLARSLVAESQTWSSNFRGATHG